MRGRGFGAKMRAIRGGGMHIGRRAFEWGVVGAVVAASVTGLCIRLGIRSEIVITTTSRYVLGVSAEVDG